MTVIYDRVYDRHYGTRKKYTGRLSAHDFGERAYDGALGHTQYRLKEAIIEAAKNRPRNTVPDK